MITKALTVIAAPPEVIWWLQWHIWRAREQLYVLKDEWLEARKEHEKAKRYVEALKVVISEQVTNDQED